MDLKVFWTDTAIEKLEEIFDHYKTKASLEVAQRIVNTIVDATITLESHPAIGQKEESLKERISIFSCWKLQNNLLDR